MHVLEYSNCFIIFYAMKCHSGAIPSKALAVLNSSIAGHYERTRCLYIQDKRYGSVYVEK